MVQIEDIDKTKVYVAKGKGYMWLNHLDKWANNGDRFDTTAGWSFYVVGVAESITEGAFTIKIWVE